MNINCKVTIQHFYDIDRNGGARSGAAREAVSEEDCFSVTNKREEAYV